MAKNPPGPVRARKGPRAANESPGRLWPLVHSAHHRRFFTPFGIGTASHLFAITDMQSYKLHRTILRRFLQSGIATSIARQVLKVLLSEE